MSKRPACSALWETPMVLVNGDVTTCCLDEHLLNKLGNTNQNTIAALWFGPTMDAWRMAQVAGRFADSGPMCVRCNWQSAGQMTQERVKEWLESRTRPLN